MHLRIEADSEDKLAYLMERFREACISHGVEVRFDGAAVQSILKTTEDFMDDMDRKAHDPKWGTPGLTCDPIVAKVSVIYQE